MKKLLTLLIVLTPLFAAAQGVRHDNIALRTAVPSLSAGVAGSILQPIPNAIVTVCAGSTLPAVGVACSPTTTIYSNIALTSVSSNPTNADGNGNYFFYATGGLQYVVSVAGSGLTTYSYVWTAPPSLAGANIWSGVQTFLSLVINTLSGSGGVLTLPAGPDTLVGRATTDTLTNKTLTSPVVNAPTLNGSGGLLTLPAGPDTLVGRATTDTLTNKTLTSPIVATIVNTGTLTLPTSTDTLVGRATTDTLTNKTLTSPTIATILNTGTLTLPTSTDTLVGRATTDTLTNKTLTSPALTTPTIGGGSTFTRWNAISTSLTCSSVPNGSNSSQSFTVTGVQAADRIVSLFWSSAQLGADMGVMSARVTGANTIALDWSNNGGAAQTPTCGSVVIMLAQ